MAFKLVLISFSFSVQTATAIEGSNASQEADESFFSSPSNSEKKLPRYRTDAKPAEKIRAYIQAGTPELEQVRLIGSLKGKQREEVVKAYEKVRAELQPMNAEFNQLRKKMSLSLSEKMLSKEEPQMDAMTKSEDFELLLKARGMLQKLRSKKLSLWEEIQAKLSPTQLEELDKLKSGQVPAEYLNTQEAANEIKADQKK
jgi:hypothetical protein